MGLEYVNLLAQKGYNVIIVALFQNETDEVASRMAAAHPDLDFLPIGIDLSAPDAPKKVYDTVAGQRPGAEVEVLINNAGMLHARHFRNMSPAQISSIIMVHNHATALLCSYYLPAMLERRRGYIMNISSLAALIPTGYKTVYPASKAYVKHFSLGMREELGRFGISVSLALLGPMPTKQEIRERIARQGLLGRMLSVSPAEAARACIEGMLGGKRIIVPGGMNRLSYGLLKLVPEPLKSKLMSRSVLRNEIGA